MYHLPVHANVHHSPARGPLLGAGYVFVWLLLWSIAQPYWVLPYGFRFGALLLTPVRYWGWLLGAELAASAGLIMADSLPSGWYGDMLKTLPEPLLTAGGLWLLRRLKLHASLQTPQDVTRLLLSVATLVIATTTADAALLALTYTPESTQQLLDMFGKALLSHYLDVLLIVPLMIMLVRSRPDRPALASLILDCVLILAPVMVVLLLLAEQPPPQPQLARVLSLAPVLLFAFRHGWRGACVAMVLTNLGITLQDQRLDTVPSSSIAYLFLAVAGTGALLLGSATDALRRSTEKVSQQNTDLGAANRRLDQLARQLRRAARGNLRIDEDRRRHLAAELHDELGQNITAIQTHMKLAQSRLHAAGMADVTTSVNAILAHMRRALHRLLDDLRPAVLDEFGLLRALDEGPIRDLLNTAGMTYRTALHGDPRLLDDDTRTAIYRLVQESATNAVKYAQASEFSLRLRIGQRRGVALAVLDLRDNGIGLHPGVPRSGRGLQGMRDRVTSLGGQFRLQPNDAGVHLRILLHGNDALADATRGLMTEAWEPGGSTPAS
jgi:two-component system sensor histidine kinase UhpB